jgi:hypothetical protein
VTEVVADLRDDLIRAFRDELQPSDPDTAGYIADIALATIKRWCAKEPTNDN